MTLEAYVGIDGATATLHLAGDPGDQDGGLVRPLLAEVAASDVRTLVVRAGGLARLPTSIARQLVLVTQERRSPLDVIVVDANPRVRHTLRRTRLDQAFTVARPAA